MSREIKFRAWDGKDHGWIEAVTYLLHTSGRLIITPPWVKLQEYTGHTDKDGVEIYEGDIVRADWCWTDPHAIEWPHDEYDFIEFGLDAEANLEVLGNTFENPELIRTYDENE